jgi:hypothetical protein
MSGDFIGGGGFAEASHIFIAVFWYRFSSQRIAITEQKPAITFFRPTPRS